MPTPRVVAADQLGRRRPGPPRGLGSTQRRRRSSVAGPGHRLRLRTIAATERPRAHELMFSLIFLDAVHDNRPEAAAQLERLGTLVPSGRRHPGRAASRARRCICSTCRRSWTGRCARCSSPDAVEKDLDRLEALQQHDGGWIVDFDRRRPPARWSGAATRRCVGGGDPARPRPPPGPDPADLEQWGYHPRPDTPTPTEIARRSIATCDRGRPHRSLRAAGRGLGDSGRSGHRW